MATDNQAKIDELFKQYEGILEKADELMGQQVVLLEKLLENAKDTDGDGIPDLDENSAGYKEILKLDEKIEKVFKEAEPVEKQLEELGVAMGGEGTLDINLVEGTDKDDKISGGDGMDDIYGDAGNDVLNGGKESDFLFGGEGNDTLTGGEGPDAFVFEKKSGKDTITDFKVGEDTIDLVGADIKITDITIKQENGGTKLSWGDNSIFLEGVTEKITEDSLMVGFGE